MKRLFRRCGHAPGAISPEDQAAVDQFRAMLTAVRNPGRPATPRTSPCGSARSSSVPTPDPETTTAPR
jgi:hypothetical protein